MWVFYGDSIFSFLENFIYLFLAVLALHCSVYFSHSCESKGFSLVVVRAKSLQASPILCDPMDYSLPGSSVHGNSPGNNTGVGCHALLQGIFPPRDRT